MADSEIQQPVDSTQQVTSKKPATIQKNPKRVAAGKAIAEKTKAAREVQKKALAEAQIIIANNQLQAAAAANPPSAAANPPADQPPTDPTTSSALTTTQWLSVISIFISVVGIYHKRKEIKKGFFQKSAKGSPPITCGCRTA